MELIRISNQKLKLMLTPTDMLHFELNAESLGEDCHHLHRSFRLLLDEVRRRTDFDADDSHLSVQYFPSREGGCEMFISRLCDEGLAEETTFSALPVPSSDTRSLKPIKPPGEFRRDCAYRFDDLDRLLRACKRLCTIACICSSTAYRDEAGRYFLLLTVPTKTPFTLPPDMDFVVEYGEMENASMLLLYLQEHARVICESGAVQQLAALA